MKRLLRIKHLVLVVLGLAAAGWGTSTSLSDSDRYVSASPSISQNFVSIPNEGALLDLCYRLRSLSGITGVSYREYSPDKGSAVVTVFYNPVRTSPRALRIFMLYPYMLWNKPSRT